MTLVAKAPDQSTASHTNNSDMIKTASITLPAYPNTVSSKQCGRTVPIRIFDEESVPKYVIGAGYKINPVNPTTTEIILMICTY